MTFQTYANFTPAGMSARLWECRSSLCWDRCHSFVKQKKLLENKISWNMHFYLIHFPNALYYVLLPSYTFFLNAPTKNTLFKMKWGTIWGPTKPGIITWPMLCFNLTSKYSIQCNIYLSNSWGLQGTHLKKVNRGGGNYGNTQFSSNKFEIYCLLKSQLRQNLKVYDYADSHGLEQALFLCTHFLSKKEKVHLISKLPPTLWQMPWGVTNIYNDWADFCRQCQ